MGDDKKILIPTRCRAKIAQYLSYPVGAEQISEALACVPQFAKLGLHFSFFARNLEARRGHYEFLEVEYSKPPYDVPGSGWDIRVLPVPRILRHLIHQYAVETALPQIAQWLVERADLEQCGSDSLVFSYDEKSEEFIPRRVKKLEPLKNRGR
jgi:hypothetical protein